MKTIVLDSGAFKAAETWDRRLAEYLDAAADEGASVLLPATVVAEMWREPPRDRSLALLSTVDSVVSLDLRQARLVGALLGKSRSIQIVDSNVAVVAIAAIPSIVLTSGPKDLLALLKTAGVSCAVGAPKRGPVDVVIERI